jgi:hypothetical protein
MSLQHAPGFMKTCNERVIIKSIYVEVNYTISLNIELRLCISAVHVKV